MGLGDIKRDEESMGGGESGRLEACARCTNSSKRPLFTQTHRRLLLLFHLLH